MQYPKEVSEGVHSPGTAGSDSCDFGCRELNLGPLEEQPVLFTAAQSLQHFLFPIRFHCLGVSANPVTVNFTSFGMRALLVLAQAGRGLSDSSPSFQTF